MFARKILTAENGIALLQVAIVLPVVLIFFAAVIDFGIALNQHLLFTRAVHEGVMFAARRPLVAAGDAIDLTTIDTNGDGILDTDGGVNLVEERIKNSIRSYSLNTQAAAILGINVDDPAVLTINAPTYADNTADPLFDTVKIKADLNYKGFFMGQQRMSIEATAPYMRF